MTKRIILFASGNGSNVEQICHFFEQDKLVSIAAVYSNNPKAGVIQRMEPFGINVKVFDKKSFIDGTLLGEIISLNPDLIILAGFLWKIGSEWTASFPQKIINIHPALLPSYGGKGMYGMNVHKP
jgi:phosphoribosylglycinamide formyltransferase-1